MEENQQSEWFEKRNGSKQEVYIPIKIANTLKLKHDSKIAVKIKNKNELIIFPARIRFRIKEDGNCFRFQIPKGLQNKIQQRKIIKIIKLNKPNKIHLKKDEIDLADFNNSSKTSIVEWIDKKSLVIWDQMKYFIIVSRKVNIIDFAKYLGLYYSDGAKTNHYCCACSTKEIAKLAFSAYFKIIKNPKFTIQVNYRKLDNDIRDENQINKELGNYWKEVVPFKIKNIKATGNKKTNLWDNGPGTLRFDDSRVLALNIHNWLIKKTIEYGKTNKNIMGEFLKGGALGDGLVSNRRKDAFQYIAISTNNKEAVVWETVFDSLEIKYDKKKDKGKDSVYIRSGNYYNAVLLFKEGLFDEYLKRRNKLFVGLKNRIETFVLKELFRSNFNPILIKNDFGRRTPSFFYVNKGGDLVKNNLITVKNNMVIVTNKGKNFINELIKLQILRV